MRSIRRLRYGRCCRWSEVTVDSRRWMELTQPLRRHHSPNVDLTVDGCIAGTLSAGGSMSQVRVHNFAISLDGFGTGVGLTLDAPFGHAGRRLHEWYFP